MTFILYAPKLSRLYSPERYTTAAEAQTALDTKKTPSDWSIFDCLKPLESMTQEERLFFIEQGAFIMAKTIRDTADSTTQTRQ